MFTKTGWFWSPNNHCRNQEGNLTLTWAQNINIAWQACCSMWRCIISGPKCLCFLLHPWLEQGYKPGGHSKHHSSFWKGFWELLPHSQEPPHHQTPATHRDFSFHRRKINQGLSLKAAPAISCTEHTPLLGPVCILQQQKHCYSMAFSAGNKNQQSIVSSWQKWVKSTPHPSNQNGTNN